MPNIKVSMREIPVGTPFRVEHEGGPIVVIRIGERGLFGYADKCPHASWPLSGGQVNDGVLECPGHGWEFSVETGACLNAPAYCLMPVPITQDGDFIVLDCSGLQQGSPGCTAEATDPLGGHQCSQSGTA